MKKYLFLLQIKATDRDKQDNFIVILKKLINKLKEVINTSDEKAIVILMNPGCAQQVIQHLDKFLPWYVCIR